MQAEALHSRVGRLLLLKTGQVLVCVFAQVLQETLDALLLLLRPNLFFHLLKSVLERVHLVQEVFFWLGLPHSSTVLLTGELLVEFLEV